MSAASVVTKCHVDDPPDECDQKTSEWVRREVLRFLRSVLLPVVLALVGAWMVLMPPLRFMTDRGYNLSRPILAWLSRVYAWLQRRLRRPSPPSPGARAA